VSGNIGNKTSAVSFVKIDNIKKNIKKNKSFFLLVSINLRKDVKVNVKKMTSSVSFLAGIHTGHDISMG
jgi:hypothetical protein